MPSTSQTGPLWVTPEIYITKSSHRIEFSLFFHRYGYFGFKKISTGCWFYTQLHDFVFVAFDLYRSLPWRGVYRIYRGVDGRLFKLSCTCEQKHDDNLEQNQLLLVDPGPEVLSAQSFQFLRPFL